jgi:hypothetical protein
MFSIRQPPHFSVRSTPPALSSEAASGCSGSGKLKAHVAD